MNKRGRIPKVGPPVGTKRARMATGMATSGAFVGPLEPGQRWNVTRKREVTILLLQGESVEGLSRELGVEMYPLEEWCDHAFTGNEATLREQVGDPGQAEPDQAMKRIGGLFMENELLRARCKAKAPLSPGRPR